MFDSPLEILLWLGILAVIGSVIVIAVKLSRKPKE